MWIKRCRLRDTLYNIYYTIRAREIFVIRTMIYTCVYILVYTLSYIIICFSRTSFEINCFSELVCVWDYESIAWLLDLNNIIIYGLVWHTLRPYNRIADLIIIIMIWMRPNRITNHESPNSIETWNIIW